jgi:hypothetical protein
MSAAEQMWLDTPPTWHRVDKFLSARLIALVDRHYSRQTAGSDQILPPGATLLLATTDERAVWGVIRNMEPRSPTMRWRCSIFRNEGGASLERPDPRGDVADARRVAPSLRRTARRAAHDRSGRRKDPPQARSGAVFPSCRLGVVERG